MEQTIGRSTQLSNKETKPKTPYTTSTESTQIKLKKGFLPKPKKMIKFL